MSNDSISKDYLRRAGAMLGEVLECYVCFGFDGDGDPWMGHSKMTTEQDYALTRMMEKYVSEEKSHDQVVSVVVTGDDG